jgi:hypothetical protein
MAKFLTQKRNDTMKQFCKRPVYLGTVLFMLLTIMGCDASHKTGFDVTTKPTPTIMPTTMITKNQHFSELRNIIENVAAADDYRYSVTDDTKKRMDGVKIIPDGKGKYLAIYHTDINGTYHASIADSSDLLHWTFQKELGINASQPYISALDNGGYVVAWEQEDPIIPPSETSKHYIAFKYYASHSDLFSGITSRTKETTPTLSQCMNSAPAEGTPNIFSVNLAPDIDHSTIDVGGHYYDKCSVDRQMRGTLTNFTSWQATPQEQIDQAVNVKGKIGDRDFVTYKNDQFLLIEGQIDSSEAQGETDGAKLFRCFLYDYHTKAAELLNFRTHRGNKICANPTITNLTAPNGKPAILVTVFIHTGKIDKNPEEAYELIYYKTYSNS